MNLENFRFVDIHSHFLFEVDDGAENEHRSLEMLYQAADNNIVHLLATPHATDLTNDETSKRFIEHFKVLQGLIDDYKIDVQISLASELFFSDKIYEWMKYPWGTFDNNRKFLLFELPLFELPRHVKDFIFQCRLEGITPILAHPERYSYLRKMQPTLIEWYQAGCLFQVNAGSITGQFGRRAQKFAQSILNSGLVHFVASDAHTPDFRSYIELVKAREMLADVLTEEQITDLFYTNPQKAIAGNSIEQSDFDESLLYADRNRLKHIFYNVNKLFRG